MTLYDAFYRWCRDAIGRDAQLADQQGEVVMDAAIDKTTEAGEAGRRSRHQLR